MGWKVNNNPIKYEKAVWMLKNSYIKIRYRIVTPSSLFLKLLVIVDRSVVVFVNCNFFLLGGREECDIWNCNNLNLSPPSIHFVRYDVIQITLFLESFPLIYLVAHCKKKLNSPVFKKKKKVSKINQFFLLYIYWRLGMSIFLFKIFEKNI